MTGPVKTARQAAFEILTRVCRGGAYSNIAIDGALDSADLSALDAAFVSALTRGVLERQISLDYVLAKHLDRPLKKLEPQVLTVLRMGAYQLLFMDKIPAEAAVDESVRLAKNNRRAYAAGLVNAVLRAVSREGFDPPRGNDPQSLSVAYSCPDWIISLWLRSYGENNTMELLKASLGKPPVFLRANTLKITAHDLKNILNAGGVSAETCASPLLPGAVELTGSPGAVYKLEAYKAGMFHVQDLASQLCALALEAKEGDSVMDVCAAPGGKSFTIAENMKNLGEVYAFDIYPQKIKLIDEGAARLGISIIKTAVRDALAPDDNNLTADRILCDVPCSGLGIIRRKPEIRYKNVKDIDNLPDIQYCILKNSAERLRPGGRLIYSTCTLNPRENQDVVNRFLSENHGFKAAKPVEGIKSADENGMFLTLMPHTHNTDGFFIAAIERK